MGPGALQREREVISSPMSPKRGMGAPVHEAPVFHPRLRSETLGDAVYASVVVLEAEVGDQVVAHDVAERVLELHGLDEQIVLGIETFARSAAT